MQIFSKEVFWLVLPWMFSLLHAVYETSTFSEIIGSDDVIFINNLCHFVIFRGIFISLKLDHMKSCDPSF